jgi:osmotically-inducible protein OsmY
MTFRYTPVTLCAMVVLWAALYSTVLATQTDYVTTDSWINNSIQSDFLLDQKISRNWIDVFTDHGIVTVSGTAFDLLTKDQAIQIAESIRGVRGVIDRINVMPVSRSDDDIRKDIVLALLQDPATESYQIAVGVKDAAVTLSGAVGSRAESKLAARISEGVRGAKEIHNDLRVVYKTKRTDAAIAADVKVALQWDIWLNGDSIYSEVKNDEVTLKGTVGTEAAKLRAVADVSVIGVSAVNDSRLQVSGWGPDDMRRNSAHPVRTDVEIKHAVESAFRRDPRVAPFSPDVSVDGGVVTLSSSVDNLKAKTAACHDARNIVGVRSVDNLLLVRPSNSPQDGETGKNLKAALLRDPLVIGSQVTVEVLNGIATLSGDVEDSLEISEAVDDASRTKGVVSVRNHLEVAPDE